MLNFAQFLLNFVYTLCLVLLFQPTLRCTILNSRVPPWNAISEGRPPIFNTSSEAGALPSELHIENDSDRKFLSPTFYFLETTFLYDSCYPDHYEPKIFFLFSSKYSFGPKIIQIIFKVFLQTTFVHVSCYPDHYEPKIFFSIFEVRNYPSIYDFGLEVPPLKCDLGRQASPLQLELGSESSRYRRYVSRMTRTKNF